MKRALEIRNNFRSPPMLRAGLAVLCDSRRRTRLTGVDDQLLCCDRDDVGGNPSVDAAGPSLEGTAQRGRLHILERELEV